jgi:hypothetical protein
VAFLTLGGTDIEVQTAGAASPERTYVGEATRAFDGTYRSGVRAAKRAWTFTLMPLLTVDADAVRTLVGLDTPLTATGDVMDGASVPVVARITGTAYIPTGVGFLEVLSLSVLEI